MKIHILIIFLVLYSCEQPLPKQIKISKEFTTEDTSILETAKRIIEEAYFVSFITIDELGQPKARIMEPFAPEEDFTIWMATNPKSRKVVELKNNPIVTLHYFNKNKLEYVSLSGNAFLIDDEVIKVTKFKEGWEQFYKNQKEDYLLIKFIPNTLELISTADNYVGDSITWKPAQVNFK